MRERERERQVDLEEEVREGDLALLGDTPKFTLPEHCPVHSLVNKCRVLRQLD